MASPSSRAPKDPAELRGNLALTRLTDVLHYLNMSRRTGTLEVMKMPDERLAKLRLRDGKVTGIVAGDQEGPRALESVLSWSKGLFRFHPGAEGEVASPKGADVRQATRDPATRDPVPLDQEAAEEEREFTRSDEMADRDTTSIMADIIKVPGIQAVVVIGRDGFVIETAGSSSAVDIDALGASLAAAVNAVEEMGTELSVSVFQDLFIEYGRAVIICRPLGDAVVALVTPDASKLGIIRHKVKSLVSDLAKFF